MTVLVDTSVWSLAMRRVSPDTAWAIPVKRLEALLGEASVAMIGPIRQEPFSEIRILTTDPDFVRYANHIPIDLDDVVA